MDRKVKTFQIEEYLCITYCPPRSRLFKFPLPVV